MVGEGIVEEMVLWSISSKRSVFSAPGVLSSIVSENEYWYNFTPRDALVRDSLYNVICSGEWVGGIHLSGLRLAVIL